MFSLIKKVFSKSYSHFKIKPIFGEFGLNFYANFARSKSVGMLFNLRGLQKLFSFIEKVFSKCYRHYRIPAIFGEFGLIFWPFLQDLWGFYLTYGD